MRGEGGGMSPDISERSFEEGIEATLVGPGPAGERQTAKMFERPEYQFLMVANKGTKVE